MYIITCSSHVKYFFFFFSQDFSGGSLDLLGGGLDSLLGGGTDTSVAAVGGTAAPPAGVAGNTGIKNLYMYIYFFLEFRDACRY